MRQTVVHELNCSASTNSMIIDLDNRRRRRVTAAEKKHSGGGGGERETFLGHFPWRE